MQSPTPPTFSLSALLWQMFGAFIVAVAVAGGMGGPILALAPQVSLGVVAPFVCPSGDHLLYTSSHQSYQRPGESTPHAECWSADGTHRDVTGPAIFTFFGAATALVFVPVFVIIFFSGLRQPRTADPQVRQAGARAPASPPPSTRLPAPTDIAQRLERLEALHNQGLLTPQEYEQKRKEILSGL